MRPGRRRSSIAWRQDSWDRNDTVLIARSPRRRRRRGVFQTGAGRGGLYLLVRGADRRHFRCGRRGPRRPNRTRRPRPPSTPQTPSVVALRFAGPRLSATSSTTAAETRFAARTALDTEGKPLAVFDALGRRTQEYVLRALRGGRTYLAGVDMMGRTLYRINADAGARRDIEDVAGPADPRCGTIAAMRFASSMTRRGGRCGAMSASAAPRRSCWIRRSTARVRPPPICAAGVFRHYDGAGYVENTQLRFQRQSAQPYAPTRQRNYKQSPDWTPLAALDRRGGAGRGGGRGRADSRPATAGATVSAAQRSMTRSTARSSRPRPPTPR